MPPFIAMNRALASGPDERLYHPRAGPGKRDETHVDTIFTCAMPPLMRAECVSGAAKVQLARDPGCGLRATGCEQES